MAVEAYETAVEVAYEIGADSDDGPVLPPSRREHFVLMVRESLLLKVGLLLSSTALILAVIGPWIAPVDPIQATPNVGLPPSWMHPFGTDASGMDVFSRVISAPRIDVTIAVVATLLSVIVGSMAGLVASFFRGRVGELIMRSSDVAQAFPLFVLAIIIVVMGRADGASSSRTFMNIVVVIVALNIPIYLRLIRSEVLSLRERTFVEAARANGDTGISIALRHVLPNAMTPGFAQVSITIGYAIIITGGLSFIGAGVEPPTPEWGAMINAGKDDIVLDVWWTTVFPGAAMALTVFGFAVVADALQTVIMRRR